MTEIKFTPMQAFALDMMKSGDGRLNAGYLAHEWAIHKTGRARVSSRDSFGYTSAAYRTLRKLQQLGQVEHVKWSSFMLKKS